MDAEKETLRKRLESIINDKIRYAAERCLEEMCKDEPYRLHPLGQLDDIDGITPAIIDEAYHKWLAASFAWICMSLVIRRLEEVKALVTEAFKIKAVAILVHTPPVNKKVKEVRTVVERMDVNQGKLNMGLRINTRMADDDYPAALDV